MDNENSALIEREPGFLCVLGKSSRPGHDRCRRQCHSCELWQTRRLCEELKLAAVFLHSHGAADGGAAVDDAVRLLLRRSS